jgi:hypothetical protein
MQIPLLKSAAFIRKARIHDSWIYLVGSDGDGNMNQGCDSHIFMVPKMTSHN